MKTNSFTKMAGGLALAFAGWFTAVSIQAQPMYDRIHVNLPYTVTMQNKTLQPGDYTIQQLPSASGDSRILLFYTKDGMKFETSAMTIPALDINTARDTKLVLNHVGDDYYISKIWVQGKDYGYELPVPDAIKGRMNERSTETTVAGTYQPSSTTDMTTTTTTTTTAQNETAPPATANSNDQSDTANRPLTTDTTASASTTQSTTQSTETAQNTQPTQPAPMQSSTQSSVSTSDNSSADRAMSDQDSNANAAAANSNTRHNGSANRDSMPSTAAGWLTMLLSGSALSGAGMMLRRKR